MHMPDFCSTTQKPWSPPFPSPAEHCGAGKTAAAQTPHQELALPNQQSHVVSNINWSFATTVKTSGKMLFAGATLEQ
jgi:hypothetical protein